MASHTSGHYIPASDPESVKHRASIVKTFVILLVITAFEFIVAFGKEPWGLNHLFVVIFFITLTLVKAFYIVADFMHLRSEVKTLILAIVLPLMFIIWFIVSMLYEGHAVLLAR
jgi:cytochrome c oxidase subunit IV